MSYMILALAFCEPTTKEPRLTRRGLSLDHDTSMACAGLEIPHVVHVRVDHAWKSLVYMASCFLQEPSSS